MKRTNEFNLHANHHSAEGLFATVPPAKPVAFSVHAERGALSFVQFEVNGSSLWLCSTAHNIRPGDYVAVPWRALSHVRGSLCHVYEVRPKNYKAPVLTSKAQVASEAPTCFAFSSIRTLPVVAWDKGLLFNAKLDPNLSLMPSSSLQLSALIGDGDKPPGIQLRFANDTFALYSVGTAATLVVVTALKPRLLTALTSL